MKKTLLTTSVMLMPLLLPGEDTSHPIAVVDIDSDEAAMVTVRTVPFKAINHPRIGAENPIHIGATADTMLLLGMINHGWDHSLAHWGEHPETWDERIDQIHLGVPIGEVVVHYSDGDTDTLPLVIGATAWFVSSWARGSVINPTQIMQEPFKSRPELRRVLDASLRLNERDGHAPDGKGHTQFYLSISPQQKQIDRLVVHNNTSKRGQPLVSGVTLLNVREAGENIIPVPSDGINWVDTHPRFALTDVPDFAPQIEALAKVLYTGIDDLPRQAEPLDYPIDFDMARLTFHGDLTEDGVDLAGMLNNYWVANLIDLNNKFEADTGFHRESGWDMPYYGGYQGLGTWGHVGIYGTSYSRCSDHFVTMALRALRNQVRVTSYVDYVDDWLTFFRTNNDPARGIANYELDADRWPEDAPGHWGFILENPLLHPWPMNELQGTEEMDGHGSVIIARWWAWRLMGAPTGDWLMEPRDHLYGLSRYDSTKEAANFITWLMDYTDRNVIYSEGESTGWGSGHYWPDETDPDVIRENYQRFNEYYQSYPAWACYIALRLSIEIAEAAGDEEHARKWATYADRLYDGMMDELLVGDAGEETWKYARHSIFPSRNEALAQAFLSTYMEGYDSNDWEPRAREITRRTLQKRMELPNNGRSVIGMGYGQGWFLHSSLAMDEMDTAANAIRDLAYYSYDKNMNFHDPLRGIDWRLYQYIFPEGSNVLPDGRWHRISDLSNGANQGPSMQALLYSAGVDDTQPDRIRIMPRILPPLNRLEVTELQTIVSNGNGGRDVALVSYDYQRGGHFILESDKPLPGLSVRLGPFTSEDSAANAIRGGLPRGATTETVVSGTYLESPAWWLWVNTQGAQSELNLTLNATE